MNAAIDEDFSEMHEPHWVLRGRVSASRFRFGFH